MKRTLFAGVMIGAVWMASAAKVETVQVRSGAMDKNVPCAVILPAQYDGNATKRWPVVYVLHGAGGDIRVWSRARVITNLVDRYGFVAVVSLYQQLFQGWIWPSWRCRTEEIKREEPVNTGFGAG